MYLKRQNVIHYATSVICKKPYGEDSAPPFGSLKVKRIVRLMIINLSKDPVKEPQILDWLPAGKYHKIKVNLLISAQKNEQCSQNDYEIISHYFASPRVSKLI